MLTARLSQFPHPIYWQRGEGSKLFDLDGNEYVDFSLNLGAAIVGHTNPAVGARVAQVATAEGTLLGGPNRDGVAVAEALQRRFWKDFSWRFCNSGTEATRSAIQVLKTIGCIPNEIPSLPLSLSLNWECDS